MKFLFLIFTFSIFFIPDFALSQNAKETIEKRRIEKYIELGSGSFYINDEVGLKTSPVSGSVLHIKGTDGATNYPRMFVIEEENTSTNGTPGISLKVNRASAYNWDIVSNFSSFGDLQFRVGASALADPSVANLILEANGDTAISTGNIIVSSSGKGLIFTNGGNTALTNYKTYTGSGSSGDLTWSYKSTRIGNVIHITVKMVLAAPTVAAGSGNGASDAEIEPPANLTSLTNFTPGNQQTNILYTTGRAFNLYTYYTDGTSASAQSTPTGTYYGTFIFELGM